VGGGDEAYRKFTSDTIGLIDGLITHAFPGTPVFAALGNNDSDRGDYVQPSGTFLQSVADDWSRQWGTPPAGERAAAVVSFERAGNYALPHPSVPNDELVILNSNLWSAKSPQACSESDPDPGGQFQWLLQVLERAKRAGGTATLIAHILPGVDAMRSSTGAPQAFWTDRCTQKLIAGLSDFRGVVREMYAGHIHRDDFRLFPDREGKPLFAIHIVPAVSPIYLDNPAVQIGWYDRRNGGLRDYATLALDLAHANPVWATEYVFSRAYGRESPDLATIADLTRAINESNPNSGVGKIYANYYAVGFVSLLAPEKWSNYSCAQTEITLPRFLECERAGVH
jgi:sphingomyelin phosphodiesterase acid-like 3